MRELIVCEIDAREHEHELNVKRQVSEFTEGAVDKVKGTLGTSPGNGNDRWMGFARHNLGPLIAIGAGGTAIARSA